MVACGNKREHVNLKDIANCRPTNQPSYSIPRGACAPKDGHFESNLSFTIFSPEKLDPCPMSIYKNNSEGFHGTEIFTKQNKRSEILHCSKLNHFGFQSYKL